MRYLAIVLVLAACNDTDELPPDAAPPFFPDGEFTVTWECRDSCMYVAGFSAVNRATVAGDTLSLYRSTCPECQPADSYQMERGSMCIFDGERYTHPFALCDDGAGGAVGTVMHDHAIVEGVRMVYDLRLTPIE